MIGQYIVDVPIYRCTKEQYDAETEKKVESHILECYERQGFPRPTEGTELALLNQRMGRYADSLGGPWYFVSVPRSTQCQRLLRAADFVRSGTVSKTVVYGMFH